jgi:hypothetical protein
VLGHGWAAEIGATVLPVKLFVTRCVGDVDVDAGGPQVVLVTQRKAENVCSILVFCFVLFYVLMIKSGLGVDTR